MSYVLYKTVFAYHNFHLHTIRVSPSAFLFVLCSNCFHGGPVKHAGIVVNNPTLDGVIYICHNRGFYLLTFCMEFAMFNFSTLFSAAIVAASFDAAIERDASNGRVNNEFQSMLSLHYGLELPAAPAQALKLINEFLTLEKAPKLAHGPGARAHAPAVGQAFHALGEALHAAGKVKALPILAALPVWADPVTIAAAAAAAADKRKATKATKATAPAAAAAAAAAATAAAATVTAPAAAATAPATAPAADMAAHVNAVIAAARGGFLSAAQVAALRAALDTAPAAAATVPTKHKGGKVRTSKAAKLVLESMARDAEFFAAAATAPAATAPAATV